MRCRWLPLLLMVMLAGCQQPLPRDGDGPPPQPFRLSALAKSDANLVAEIHLQHLEAHLQTLMRKLYRRNPIQLQRGGGVAAEERIRTLFDTNARADFQQWQGCSEVDCIRLALDPDYHGDRVLAFVGGLTMMLRAAYNNQREFYLFSSLDPQKLYNSARNIEIAVWRLSTATDSSGRLLILSNSSADELRNLSYERLFGKLISLQDTLAVIVADNSNRLIKKILQNMATAIFLPV